MPAPSPQQAVSAAQLPLPARPLARSLLLSLQSLPGLTDEDRTTGWAAALFTVCTRPSLIAITGDGFGVTPPANGPRTQEPVVVVAECLQKHLAPLLASQQPTEVVAGYQGENPIMVPALSLTLQCVPAGTFASGVFGLWQLGGKNLTPLQRVGEWPDVVVQVGVAATLPQRYPVPLVLAPVDWSDPDAAAHTLAEQCAQELVAERCVQLAMNVAAGCGFHSEALELMMRRFGCK